MGDAHSSSGLPTRLRLDKAEEVLVLHDLAVRLRELRVAVHSLGFQGCEAGLRVVGPVLERLGCVEELVHVHAVPGARSASSMLSVRRRWCLRFVSPWALSLAAKDLDATLDLDAGVVGEVRVDTLSQVVPLRVHTRDRRVGFHEAALGALDALLQLGELRVD